MRIAVIERFSNASRNCGKEPLPGAGAPGSVEDEVHVVRLRGSDPPPSSKRSTLALARRELARLSLLPMRCLGALAGIAADRELSSRDKRTLIASALATRGAPLAALAGTPEILQLLRSKRFDRIDCFSTRGFALVPVLSELLGIPYREFLSEGTRYFGEFAFELLAVVPYAYWLHTTGRLRVTQSSVDTKCLYYFSTAHEEISPSRSYVPISEYPNGATSALRFDAHAFPRQLDTTKWVPPPYKSIYGNAIFRWPREMCIICNKFTSEPSTLFRQAVNFIDVPELMKVLEALTPRYQVVYVRPRPNDIVNDHQSIREFGDFAAIREHYPDVVTIQQLHAGHPEMTFNELQMKLFANCTRFVSVLGGSSYLASYFGGTNIVYAREGWEVSCNAYANWFHLFSGARVLQAANPSELHQLVRREFAS